MTTGRVALRAGAAIAAVLTATTLSRPEAAATRTRQPDAVHPQPRPWAPLVDGTIGTRFETVTDSTQRPPSSVQIRAATYWFVASVVRSKRTSG